SALPVCRRRLRPGATPAGKDGRRAALRRLLPQQRDRDRDRGGGAAASAGEPSCRTLITSQRGPDMKIGSWWLATGLGLVVGTAAMAAPPAEEEAPAKRGGTLTYVIPADAPPSFDAHREGTFATLHSVAPFYSVLIRVNPENPSSTTDFVCDLC